MLEIWKCIICKKPYIGLEKPSHCPNCGVLSRYIARARDDLHEDFYLEPAARKLIEELMQRKAENLKFYGMMPGSLKDAVLKDLFGALQNTADAQIRVIESFGIEKPKVPGQKIYEFVEDNIAEAFHRKKGMLELYSRLIKEISDPYIVEVLGAFSEAEEEHMHMLEDLMA